MELLALYAKKYKENIITASYVLASLLLIVFVILPQFSTLSVNNAKVAEKEENVKKLLLSSQTVATLSRGDIASDLSTVTAALPEGKDIIILYNAISDAARRANVDITSFSLKVGGVFGGREENAARPLAGFPSVEVVAHVTSHDYRNVLAFLQYLYDAFPIAEVTKVNLVDTESIFDVNFYYKPYDLASLSRQNIIQPLSVSDSNLLTKLRSMGK